jgi:hypothetical protein
MYITPLSQRSDAIMRRKAVIRTIIGDLAIAIATINGFDL